MRFTILFFAAVLSLVSALAHADSLVWKEIATRSNASKQASLSGAKAFQFDAAAFQEMVKPQQRQINLQPFTIVELPLPSGEILSFQGEAYTFEEFPGNDFQAWKVVSTTDPAITGRIDYSSVGFHATLFMPDGEVVIIDPQEFLGENQRYDVKYKSDTHTKKDFSCTLHDHPESRLSKAGTEVAQRAARGLKTYRLAMAATRQYTRYFGGIDNALNAVRATINRVNTIYARDLELQLILVSGTNLMFTDTMNPYNEALDLKDQNTRIINSIIGVNAYDIGHLVSQGGSGGIAGLSSVCDANRKGMGFTSLSVPQGDAFDIDFVSHEIGHQFGATHTFNSNTGSCSGRNRTTSTAYEPGSGSTIMAYAGICLANDLQANSDAVFHIASIEQIDSFVRSGGGASCGGTVGTGNSAPDIDTTAVTQNLFIKAGEPFTLTGAASDVDGDTLAYNWDQFDAGTATDVNVDAGDNALYRSTLPSASPSRTFPGLTTKTRNLRFKFVVRDGKGGVSSTTTMVNVTDGEAPGTPPSSVVVSSGGGGAMFKLLIMFGVLWGIGLFRNRTL
ncbi:MAG: Unknown protein [uncultured Thiotrichaceae bacterium]|uniref:Peptidase M12B domain-containing protein n=1 Tax=uncultured Thiotrichaceae bacterium TaxID=298394 RepID=A0A6S6U145_9GAMM|nr:MAG: Unknown protein [uncultured Thiotrichaceae bacterium]